MTHDRITIAPSRPPSPSPPSPSSSTQKSPPKIHPFNDTASTKSALNSSSSSSSWISSSSSRRRPAIGSCAHLSATECARLWDCMLGLQRELGCYRRCARMEAALYLSDRGLAADTTPSQATMDLLNDSLDEVPEEALRKLAAIVPVSGFSPPSAGDERDLASEKRRKRGLRVLLRLVKRLSWMRGWSLC